MWGWIDRPQVLLCHDLATNPKTSTCLYNMTKKEEIFYWREIERTKFYLFTYDVGVIDYNISNIHRGHSHSHWLFGCTGTCNTFGCGDITGAKIGILSKTIHHLFDTFYPPSYHLITYFTHTDAFFTKVQYFTDYITFSVHCYVLRK